MRPATRIATGIALTATLAAMIASNARKSDHPTAAVRKDALAELNQSRFDEKRLTAMRTAAAQADSVRNR